MRPLVALDTRKALGCLGDPEDPESLADLEHQRRPPLLGGRQHLGHLEEQQQMGLALSHPADLPDPSGLVGLVGRLGQTPSNLQHRLAVALLSVKTDASRSGL